MLDPRFDAFSDIRALSTNYELLDAQYPGSRFVLTVRPIDEWIASRRRHVESNVRRQAAGEYHGTFLDRRRAGVARRVAGTRRRRARAYFAGRADFLEIDLTARRGLAAAVRSPRASPSPTSSFPWINRNQTAKT